MRRALIVVLPLLLVGVLVAGFALAPTTPHRDSPRAGGTDHLLPPSAGSASSRLRSASTSSVAKPIPKTVAAAGGPDRRPAPHSSQGSMLAVARRFAVAYMPYQIGRLPRWARTAIEQTCTAAFARYLLSHPAQLTSLLVAHPADVETYRVASVNPAAGADRVAVSYLSRQDSADTGAFVLALVREQGRWLVAGLGS